MPKTTLRTIVCDFYNLDLIIQAKTQLLEDVSGLQIDEKLPHIPRRRDSADRLQKEVDDIFAILAIIDENKLFQSLPKYAVTNPDDLPPVKLYEGDVKFLISKIDNMANTLEKVMSSLAAMSVSVQSLPETVQQAVNQTIQACVEKCEKAEASKQNITNRTMPMPMTSRPHYSGTFNTRTHTDNHQNSVSGPSTAGCETETLSWADQVNMRQSVTSATDDDGDFTLVESKRRRQKRARVGTSPTVNSQQQQQSNSAAKQQPSRPKKLLVGKASSGSTGGSSQSHNSAIRAAKPVINKSILCIDNVSTDVTHDEMTRFITDDLKVEVISLYKAKPRRRRYETADDVSDRQAFRLCIKKDDEERLLDDTAWPADVFVYEWFFKSAAPKNQTPTATATARNNTVFKKIVPSAPATDITNTVTATATAIDSTATAMDTTNTSNSTVFHDGVNVIV